MSRAAAAGASSGDELGWWRSRQRWRILRREPPGTGRAAPAAGVSSGEVVEEEARKKKQLG